jgi:hypothetical protein
VDAAARALAARADEKLDQLAFEPGLRRPMLRECVLQPALDPTHTVLAAASMPIEIAGHLGGAGQTKVSCVFGSALEAVLVERGAE